MAQCHTSIHTYLPFPLMLRTFKEDIQVSYLELINTPPQLLDNYDLMESRIIQTYEFLCSLLRVLGVIMNFK
jgi:hypothetical protein